MSLLDPTAPASMAQAAAEGITDAQTHHTIHRSSDRYYGTPRKTKTIDKIM